MLEAPALSLIPLLVCSAATTLGAQSTASAPEPGASAPARFAWGDHDGDGLDDAFVIQGTRGRLLRNGGDGSFREVTQEVGLGGLDACAFALWEDVDGDRDLDLYVGTRAGRARLFLAHESDTFVDASATSGLDHEGEELRATFLDYDRDGAPDLLVCTRAGERLYHNLGDGLFEAADLGFSAEVASLASPAPLAPASANRTAAVDAIDSDAAVRTKSAEAAQDRRSRAPARATTARTPASAAPAPAPAGGGASSSPESEAATAFPSCARRIHDRSGGCLAADSTPTLGRLYPLSSTLFVSPSSRVGVNTTSPGHDLDVNGDAGLRGDLSFATGQDGICFPDVPSSANPVPLISMYDVDTENASRMVVAHSKAFPQWGVRYDDALDEFVFQTSQISPVLEVGLGTSEIRAHEDLVVDDANLHLELGGSTRASLHDDPNSLGGAELAMYDVDGNQTVELVGDASDLSYAYLGLQGFLSPTSSSRAFLVADVAGALHLDEPVSRDLVRCDTFAGAERIYANSSHTTTTTPTVRVRNASTAGGAYGVHAEMTSTSTGSFSAAVRGESAGTGGGGIGVYGSHAGNGYAVYGASFGSAGYGLVGAGDTAVWSAGDLVVSGTKSFVQPHPSDPALEIRFSALEGNESGTYFRGTSELAGGRATIEVPEEFRWASEPDGVTVQLTPIGAPGLWIESQTMERIVVRGEQDVRFHYFVQGRRRGFDEAPVVTTNRHFVPRFRGEAFGAQYPEELIDVLVRNGTLEADGTPKQATADRLGWTLIDRAELEARVEADRRAGEQRRMHRPDDAFAPRLPVAER